MGLPKPIHDFSYIIVRSVPNLGSLADSKLSILLDSLQSYLDLRESRVFGYDCMDLERFITIVS
jgi:hypothetical protein